MELLFKREQTSGRVGRVVFKLWSKIDPDEEEKAVIARYKLDETILLFSETPNLLRNSILVGLGAAFLVYVLMNAFLSPQIAGVIGLIVLIGVAYWWYHDKRETIYVRDLLHGRHTTCHSIIDLAKQEARLSGVVEIFRQVMESAKHWDGTEHRTVPVLDKEEARALVASL